MNVSHLILTPGSSKVNAIKTVQLLAEVHPLDGPYAVIRTDPAPGFKALVNDQLLNRRRISIELGRSKNVNKNPVAERAIQELEDEILYCVQTFQTRSSHLFPCHSLQLASTRVSGNEVYPPVKCGLKGNNSNHQLPIVDSEVIV